MCDVFTAGFLEGVSREEGVASHRHGLVYMFLSNRLPYIEPNFSIDLVLLESENQLVF